MQINATTQYLSCGTGCEFVGICVTYCFHADYEASVGGCYRNRVRSSPPTELEGLLVLRER